jgi:hypothetical protein
LDASAKTAKKETKQMTAIGCLLMIIGAAIMGFSERKGRVEMMGVGAFLFGSTLTAVGIIVWLWRVMP